MIRAPGFSWGNIHLCGLAAHTASAEGVMPLYDGLDDGAELFVLPKAELHPPEGF